MVGVTDYRNVLSNTKLATKKTILQKCLSAVFLIAVYFTLIFFFAVHLTAVLLTPVYFNILYVVGVQIIELHKEKQKTWPTFLNYSRYVSCYSFLECDVPYADVLLYSALDCSTLNFSVLDGFVQWWCTNCQTVLNNTIISTLV